MLLKRVDTYSSMKGHTQEPKVVESFCVFFKDGFAEEVFHSLNETNDCLLSDPIKDTSSIGFFEKTYHKNNTLSSQLETFKQILPSLDIDSVGYEEQFHKIMYSNFIKKLKIKI